MRSIHKPVRDNYLSQRSLAFDLLDMFQLLQSAVISSSMKEVAVRPENQVTPLPQLEVNQTPQVHWPEGVRQGR